MTDIGPDDAMAIREKTYKSHVRSVRFAPRALLIPGVAGKNTDVIPTLCRRGTDRGFSC